MKAGSLEIQLLMDVARLQTQMRDVQKAVGVGMDGIVSSANRADRAMGRVVVSAGQMRAGAQQLSYQIGDVTQQFALGTPVMTIFAQQGGQVVQAIGAMRGEAKGFIGFMAGPWGAVIMGAAMIVGMLASKFLDSGEAAEEAAKGLKAFQDRQSDIGSFIDATTGRLVEQNRVLVQNAVLTRQARIEKNNEAIRGQREAAFKSAGTAAAGGRFVQIAGSLPEGMGPAQVDPAISRVIRAANGDVEKLSLGLGDLARRRPDLRGVVTDISTAAGQAIILTRENRKLGEEVDQLTSKTRAQGKATSEMIKRQVELATATTPLERARAAYNIVAERGAKADKMGGAALEAYRRDLTAAAVAVNRAEREQKDAQEGARAARRAESKEESARNKAIREAAREYESAVKAAKDYAGAQREAAETVGFTTKQLREYADAKAIAAATKAGVPAAEIQAIRDEAKAREAAISGQNAKDFATNILQPLKDELALYGMVGPARDLAALGLEKESFMARNISDGVEVATKRWNEYYDAKSGLIGKAAADAERDSQISFGLDMLREMEVQAGITGDALRDAFGSAGGAIADMVGAMQHYGVVQAEIGAQRDKDIRAAGTNQAEINRITILSAERSKSAQLEQYGAIAGAAKGLFKEHSAGYRAMAALEKVYAALQLVNMVKSMAMDTTQTASSVANAAVRGTADTAAGGAKMFGQLGVFAFPAVAAMIALLASMGVKTKGGGKNSAFYADAMQAAQGTGTVLGDSAAKSESLSRSLDLMSKSSIKELEYSNEMLRSLRSIDGQIGALTSSIARQIGAGSMFGTAGLKLGSNTTASGLLGGIGAAVGNIPIIGGVLGGLFGSTKITKKLVDQGIQFNAARLAEVLASGSLYGSTYQEIEKTKKKSGVFGIGGSTTTSYSTKKGGLDDSIERQAGLVLENIYGGVLSAARTIGVSWIEDLLRNYVVSIGKVSLKDLKGDDLTAAINAVFSAEADKMATYALGPFLSNFQKVGEGLFETLARLAKDYQTVDVQLQSIGRTFGAVGFWSVEAREALVDLFGSLDTFVEQTGFYREHFLTEAQQIAPVMTAVAAELVRLNLSGVDTIAKFKGVVDGLDLTTDAGRELYAALMALAPGFSAVEAYQDTQAQAASDLARKRADMEIALLGLQGNAAAASARQRAAELAAMDESLRPLQQQIYLAQDVADALKVLTDAYNREKDALTATKTKFEGFSTSLKAFRDGLYAAESGVASYRALQVKLMSTGALAAAGDETALGALEGVGKDFLEAARNRAGSLAQYQRDVAMVARYATDAATAADDAVDYAQAQLSALDAAVAAQIDINENVISVHDALLAIEALLQPGIPGLTTSADGAYAPVPTAVMTQPVSVAVEGPSNKEVLDELAKVRAGIEAIAFSNHDMNQRQKAQDGGGFVSVGTLDGDVLAVRDVGP